MPTPRAAARAEAEAWSAEDAAVVSAALDALGEVFRVSLARPVRTRRVWLDTADWRLFRKGLALTATTVNTADGEACTLDLIGPDGLTRGSAPYAGSWPRLIDGLPEALVPHLADVLGIRAVLPVVAGDGSQVTGRLLDDEAKTVVRLVHERPGTLEGSRRRLPARIRLQPVRGYQAQAARAARILCEAGLQPQEPAGYRAALGAADLDPDAPGAPPMTPELPAPTAIARVLLSFLTEMEASTDGTIADVDTEFLHDFRVAVRRSRSAVKLLGDVLPTPLSAWAGVELKWLGDLTTPLRDLDVHLLGMPELAARVSAGRPDDLDPLVAHLWRLRAGERRALVRGLRSARFQRFRTRWRAQLEPLAGLGAGESDGDLDGLDSTDHGDEAVPTAERLGRLRLARADRRVIRPGSRITPDSPAEDLHELRKRCKELRYLLEIFAPLLDPADARGVVKQLKGLQDVLGTFQDSEVQREAIYTLAEQLVSLEDTPARTLLAMGEIAAQLHEDQVRARAAFAAEFERFAQTPARQRILR